MKLLSSGKSCFLLILAAQAALGGTDGWSRTGPSGEPFGPTRQAQRNCQGRNCGAGTAFECGPGTVDITPNPAIGSVGIPLSLRYDATQICNGQTISDPDFSVRWDDGPSIGLGDAYGFFTKTFTTQGEHHAVFEVRCTCVDRTGQSKCILTGTVRVTIGAPPSTVSQNQINSNFTLSTPFVSPDGWVWFRGLDNRLWKVFNDGSQQSQPGNNTTSSSPFVQGDYVYFRGTDDRLWRMKTDGSSQNQINNNFTLSTPFVSPDGWVWFRGVDNRLWKVFNDGSQQSQPRNNTTSSSPFVQGAYVYFRGTDDKLRRMKTDGSSQNVINNNLTLSTPFVTPDGWVWFQGVDNRLWKVLSDGTGQSQPGNNTTSSPPFVQGAYVYFRGTDDRLWRMRTDGSNQTVVNNNFTSSSPFVTIDNWVYFRGIDDRLWRCFFRP